MSFLTFLNIIFKWQDFLTWSRLPLWFTPIPSWQLPILVYPFWKIDIFFSKLYFHSYKLQIWRLFFYYFCPIFSFHLFVHPLLGLDCHNIGWPLCMAGLLLHDIIACCANLFRWFHLVKHISTQRKDNYIFCPVYGTIHSETFLKNKSLRKKLLAYNWIKLGSLLESI